MSKGGPDARDPVTQVAREAAAEPMASGALAVRWMLLAARRIAERRAWLTELDAAIGDGDHGINLDRGMQALRAGLEDGSAPTSPTGALLEWAGRTITGTVGGASGALYGRAFLRAAASLAVEAASVEVATVATASVATPATVRTGTERRSTERAAQALDAAVAGIAALGRSGPGEKTMLDALLPAARVLRASAAAGRELRDALLAAADAAEGGAGATIPMLATKGRASYLGERSIGHLDPGAASSAILLRALADAATGRR